MNYKFLPDDSGAIWMFVCLFLFILLMVNIFFPDKTEWNDLEDTLFECQSERDDLEQELDEANLKLQATAEFISSVKEYAWSTYYDMGNAIDYLPDPQDITP
jgi:hypothetical protein